MPCQSHWRSASWYQTAQMQMVLANAGQNIPLLSKTNFQLCTAASFLIAQSEATLKVPTHSHRPVCPKGRGWRAPLAPHVTSDACRCVCTCVGKLQLGRTCVRHTCTDSMRACRPCGMPAVQTCGDEHQILRHLQRHTRHILLKKPTTTSNHAARSWRHIS